MSNSIVMEEINEWISSSENILFEFKDYSNNICTFFVVDGYEMHVIRMHIPQKYPENKLGFRMESSSSEFMFLNKLNQQLLRKKTSITSLFTYTHNYIKKLWEIETTKESDTEEKPKEEVDKNILGQTYEFNIPAWDDPSLDQVKIHELSAPDENIALHIVEEKMREDQVFNNPEPAHIDDHNPTKISVIEEIIDNDDSTKISVIEDIIDNDDSTKISVIEEIVEEVFMKKEHVKISNVIHHYDDFDDDDNIESLRMQIISRKNNEDTFKSPIENDVFYSPQEEPEIQIDTVTNSLEVDECSNIVEEPMQDELLSPSLDDNFHKEPEYLYDGIRYDDIVENYGIFIDSSKLTRQTNYEDIRRNALRDISKHNPFNAEFVTTVLLNEYISLVEMQKEKHFRIELPNLNLSKFVFHIEPNFFGSDNSLSLQIEITPSWNSYPFDHPNIRLVSPILDIYDYIKIINIPILNKANWIAKYRMIDILEKINIDDIENSDTSVHLKYNDLYHSVIQSYILSNSSFATDTESQATNKSGKGYGTGAVTNKSKMKTIEDIKSSNDVQLANAISSVNVNLAKMQENNEIDNIYDIISHDIYIDLLRNILDGKTILSLSENKKSMQALIDQLCLIPRQCYDIFLKKKKGQRSLEMIFHDIFEEIESYKKIISKKTKDDDNFNNRLRRTLMSIQKRIKLMSTEKTKIIKKTAFPNDMCFGECELNVDNYNKMIKSDDDASTLDGNNIKHIAKEMMSLRKSLPLSESSRVFYMYDNNNLKLHEFIITGPENTPYDGGCFHFRMFLPKNYPDVCPIVRIMTTGNGTMRFNPNLYSDGTVCLSLLGTWKGDSDEEWIPRKSTILQLIVSIQSLILIDEPYFNEPGYQTAIGTENGINKSIKYNKKIRAGTMKYAIYEQLVNPPKGFEELIITHFKVNKQRILNTCSTWIQEDENLIGIYEKIKGKLEKL